MQQHELDALFDQQAAGYDARWVRMAPIRDSLLFLIDTVFATLPDDAHVLCVGAGTGAEIGHLARRFPRWTFLALDPSTQMIAACRARAEREGSATGRRHRHLARRLHPAPGALVDVEDRCHCLSFRRVVLCC